MTIDPRNLRLFLAVCRAGSISAAARNLNISQPSVSVMIAQLERSLGVKLFGRSRSGVELNASGWALRSRAEALESLLETAEREIALLQQDVIGPMTIGGTPGALFSLVPVAANTLRRAGMRFQLQILERADAELIELLRNQRIELAIVTTGIDVVADDIVEEQISRDPFDLIVGEANAHLPDSLNLRDLTDMAWVLPDAAGSFRRQLDALFIAADARLPSNVIRSDSLITTKAIVRQSDYVTILPRQVNAHELATGALRAITLADARFMRTIGVRRLRKRKLSPLAERFIQALRQIDPMFSARDGAQAAD